MSKCQIVKDSEGQPSPAGSLGTVGSAPPCIALPGSLKLFVTWVQYTIFHQPMGWGDQEQVTQPTSCFQMGNLEKQQSLDCSPELRTELKGTM